MIGCKIQDSIFKRILEAVETGMILDVEVNTFNFGEL
jgi:hypothetical protein